LAKGTRRPLDAKLLRKAPLVTIDHETGQRCGLVVTTAILAHYPDHSTLAIAVLAYISQTARRKVWIVLYNARTR
jgi:hypothetical protein